MYLLGYDIGTSSVKATLMEGQTGKAAGSANWPKKEMEIIAVKPGWAEQQPEDWWENLKKATGLVLTQAGIDAGDIEAIGITYQMHGLVCVDRSHEVIRPAIIWCDSRAVEIGDRATEAIGPARCLEQLLNYPGNFTASKLKWVKDNEPDNYEKIFKMMLPGDYIAMKLTGDINTTASGLSEGILWDFQRGQVAKFMLDHYGFSPELIPDITGTFGVAGQLSGSAAEELGLKKGIKVSYRAGDQPNNAFSLNVLEPGQVAATAGTSGVVYGIGDKPNYDSQSRVNTFLHVNSKRDRERLGVLLCVNGTGILNSWLKHNAASGMDYPEMNALAAKVPVGSDGLVIIPYGNGAERTLSNKDIGASINGLNFNIHGCGHLLRAGQEGIVFALNYGLEILRGIGIKIETVRAGDANMFLSPLFCSAFATVTNSVVELYNTDGSQGAARAAGVGAGIYKDFSEAFVGLEKSRTVEPDRSMQWQYMQAYNKWQKVLESRIG